VALKMGERRSCERPSTAAGSKSLNGEASAERNPNYEFIDA